LFIDGSQKVKVRPVYAYESQTQVEKDLAQQVGAPQILGYYQSGCQVFLERSIEHPKTPLEPGPYKLNTLRTDGFMMVTDPKGNKSAMISAKKFVEAGLKRI
jgi:hypothetical protein